MTRSRTTAHRVVERAEIVLASAVTCWLDRYEADGVAGLVTDRPRSGRPKQISATDEAAIIDRTLHTRPPRGFGAATG